MREETVAEWMRRQGVKVIQTQSTYWYEAATRVYQAFPYHWLIEPDESELSALLARGALALRYSAPVESPRGAISYHVVYESPEYDLGVLPSNARGHIRKALKLVTVEPISLERLADEGWELRRQTLIRQGRQQAETESWWRKLCLSAIGLPGFEAWAALAEGKLVAALFAMDYGDYYSILFQQSRTDYLRFGVNSALTFVVSRDALGRSGSRVLFYGLHSLDAPASVDDFKFQLKYVARPVRQRVEFHPWARPFVNRVSHLALRLGARILPGSYPITKSEGMVRLNLDGKLPLSQQPIPAPLEQQFHPQP